MRVLLHFTYAKSLRGLQAEQHLIVQTPRLIWQETTVFRSPTFILLRFVMASLAGCCWMFCSVFAVTLRRQEKQVLKQDMYFSKKVASKRRLVVHWLLLVKCVLDGTLGRDKVIFFGRGFGRVGTTYSYKTCSHAKMKVTRSSTTFPIKFENNYCNLWW